MKEIDTLNSVKFTDGNGVMHLFPEEEEGNNNLLPFRYIKTAVWIEDYEGEKPEIDCTIREREFFIPDGGISIYKDLYLLDPVAFVLYGNGYSWDKAENGLEMLGYSSDEIEEKIIETANYFKYIPVLDEFFILEKGETYADAYSGNVWGNDLGWSKTCNIQRGDRLIQNENFRISIWSPDLMDGISLADFFGDENDWKKELKVYDKINCRNDVVWDWDAVKVLTA